MYKVHQFEFCTYSVFYRCYYCIFFGSLNKKVQSTNVENFFCPPRIPYLSFCHSFTVTCHVCRKFIRNVNTLVLIYFLFFHVLCITYCMLTLLTAGMKANTFLGTWGSLTQLPIKFKFNFVDKCYRVMKPAEKWK